MNKSSIKKITWNLQNILVFLWPSQNIWTFSQFGISLELAPNYQHCDGWIDEDIFQQVQVQPSNFSSALENITFHYDCLLSHGMTILPKSLNFCCFWIFYLYIFELFHNLIDMWIPSTNLFEVLKKCATLYSLVNFDIKS